MINLTILIKKIIQYSLIFYQKYLSEFLPQACRFYPTCSQYSSEAIKKYGVCKGMGLTIRRILKCHPFHPGGYDPVDMEG